MFELLLFSLILSLGECFVVDTSVVPTLIGWSTIAASDYPEANASATEYTEAFGFVYGMNHEFCTFIHRLIM
jgi:hypothetical protein